MCFTSVRVMVNVGMQIGAMSALRSSSPMALIGMRAKVTCSRKSCGGRHLDSISCLRSVRTSDMNASLGLELVIQSICSDEVEKASSLSNVRVGAVCRVKCSSSMDASGISFMNAIVE